jgi:hypothetical protein
MQAPGTPHAVQIAPEGVTRPHFPSPYRNYDMGDAQPPHSAGDVSQLPKRKGKPPLPQPDGTKRPPGSRPIPGPRLGQVNV